MPRLSKLSWLIYPDDYHVLCKSRSYELCYSLNFAPTYLSQILVFRKYFAFLHRICVCTKSKRLYFWDTKTDSYMGVTEGLFFFQNNRKIKCGVVRSSHLHQTGERLKVLHTCLKPGYMLWGWNGRCQENNPAGLKLWTVSVVKAGIELDDLPRQIWPRSQLARGKHYLSSLHSQRRISVDALIVCFVVWSSGKVRVEVVPDGHVQVEWHLNFFEDKVIKIIFQLRQKL